MIRNKISSVLPIQLYDDHLQQSNVRIGVTSVTGRVHLHVPSRRRKTQQRLK
jgi:hypothetical protein